MKSRPTGKHAGKWLSGCFLLFLLLAISACGGGNTTHVYDNARVLNTSKVQNTAANLPADVDIYTVNNFAGTQTEFQRAVQSKLGGNSNRIVMAVDTLHNYVYIAKGSSVPLSGTDISRSVNSFAANYGRGNYTGATVAALNTMNGPLQQANNRNSGPSPALWLLPLVILAGLLFMLFKARQPARVTRSTGYSPTPTYTPPRPDYPPQGGYRPSPRQEDTTSPPAAGGATDYDLGKRQGERRADASNRDNITGGGGRFGSGGSDYGSSESGGGGRFGKGGSDYDQGRGSEYDKGGGRFGKGGSDYDQGSGSEYDKGGGRNF